MNKQKLILYLVAIALFLPLISASGLAEEAIPVKDFNISKIVLCDPDDPLCRPRLFFEAGKTMRINVLENFSTQMRGEYRTLTLYFYDQNETEVLKASKVEQFIWGPHINDKWLCFLSNAMDSGVYRLRMVVEVGQKAFEKSVTFSLVNPTLEAKKAEMEKRERERQKDRGEEGKDQDTQKPEIQSSPKPDSQQSPKPEGL